ncbi:MAG: hypothetical protein OQL08_01675 [Gammaproteobacteria bacterium]|nr:hypothetical protein [Gammaproteobacteria bacterium]
MMIPQKRTAARAGGNSNNTRQEYSAFFDSITEIKADLIAVVFAVAASIFATLIALGMML